MYCTIRDDGTGAPYRYYPTKEAALAAAQRLARRERAGVEVAWCKDAGNPKVWLAYVLPGGVVEKTQYWQDTQDVGWYYFLSGGGILVDGPSHGPYPTKDAAFEAGRQDNEHQPRLDRIVEVYEVIP